MTKGLAGRIYCALRNAEGAHEHKYTEKQERESRSYSGSAKTQNCRDYCHREYSLTVFKCLISHMLVVLFLAPGTRL